MEVHTYSQHTLRLGPEFQGIAETPFLPNEYNQGKNARVTRGWIFFPNP
jgi:hypothetical protein